MSLADLAGIGGHRAPRRIGFWTAPPSREVAPGERKARPEGRVGRWWYAAAGRQRAGILCTGAATTAVIGIAISQVVVPFWWTNAAPGGLSSLPVATPQSAVFPTFSQQALWGMITGQPGAAPAAPAAPSAPVVQTAPAPAAATPAPSAVTVRVVSAPPAAAPSHPAARVPVKPPPAAVAAIVATTRALPTVASVNAIVVRNLEQSGAAKLLCAHNPPEVLRLGLQSYCAALAASPDGSPPAPPPVSN